VDAGVFEQWTQRVLRSYETALDAWVPASAPAGLGEAMRHAAIGGGKRLRPLNT